MLIIGKYKYIKKAEEFLSWRSSILVLKLLVLSGEAKAVAPLSPVLGQYTLNTTDFCSKFNEETVDILSGLPVRLNFYIYLRDKEFKYEILQFSFVTILKSIYFKDISVLEFYKICITYCYLNNIVLEGTEFKDAMLSVRGILKSLQCTFLLYYE